MTACRNKARGAVVAALAGALTLGAAPVMALADGASLMADEADQVAQATVTKADDEDGYPLDLSQPVKFAYDRYAHYVVPTEITNERVEPDQVLDVAEEGYTVVYMMAAKPNENGAVQLGNGDWVKYEASIQRNTVGIGTYYAVVKSGSESVAGSNAFVKYEIVNNTFEGAYVCDGTDADDSVIEYDGTEQAFGDEDLSVVVDGVVRNKAWFQSSGGTINVYKDGEVNAGHEVTAKDAGKYVARVKAYNVIADIPFEIVPLDVASSKVSLDEVEYASVGTDLPTQVTKVGDATVNDWSDGQGTIGTGTVSLRLKEGTAPTPTAPVKKGEYTYVVSAKDAEGNLVDGSEQEVTVVRYENEANIRYDRDNLTDGETIRTFDPSKVDAVDSNGKKLEVSIAYYKNGVEVDASKITEPGDYEAVITALDDTCTYGGRKTVKFSVRATLVKIADVYASYRGETLKNDAIEDIYDGTDLMGNFSVKAIDEDGAEVPADALDIVVTDADGDEVDGVVEAGTYTVAVKAAEGSKYLVEEDAYEISFKVDKVEADYDVQWNDATKNDYFVIKKLSGNVQLRLSGTMGYGSAGDSTYLYTGEAVVPAFEYDLDAAMWGYDKAEDWKTLPAETYELEYQVWDGKSWEKVDEAVEAGTYKAVIDDGKADDSYDVEGEFLFRITDTKVFADVPNDEWYSEYVYTAASAGFGYMSGYGDGTFFGPADTIKRGDVAVVLFKMAGGELYADTDEGKTDANYSFETPFSDVDGHTYYAEAIQWAQRLGIVSGDGGADTFRPEDTVTREELAKMLYNYMALQGETEDVDADAVLGEYEDESSVSGWAREYVAWLVEQEVMGQDSGLRGDQPISRAEVATMAVRLQPNGALEDADFLK